MALRKKTSPIKKTTDPHLNDLMEQLLTLQQIEKERNAFSQRVGKTGTFTWDIKNNESTWTREFEALYGFPNGGFDGGNFDTWLKYIHPEDRKSVGEEMEKALKHGDEMNIEFRALWPDKSVHHLLTRARIIRDSKGKALEVSGVNIDISERKQIELNLQYLAKTSKLLASSLDYNQTLKLVAELCVPEIADWCSVDMLTEKNEIKRLAVAHKDPKQVKWAWEMYKKNPPSLNRQEDGVVIVLKTGQSLFVSEVTDEMIKAAAKNPKQLKLLKKLHLKSIMIVPLNVEGKTIGAISFISTDTNHLYKQSDLTIAEEVASRAALAIHNARLFSDSQHAISVRDEFISVASHELKTPVTSLKMYTQIILRQLEKQPNTTVSSPLSKINTQIDKLTNLINDLLNISRIQLGKLEFNEERFSIYDLIKEIVDSLQSSTDDHAILVKGKTTKKVWGDRDRISQVITNLLTNAIKYSPGAPHIFIKITEDFESVKISIKDFGIGIDKEQQKKIFNRFYRVGGEEEKTYPGLGIGLYISSEIIKRHNSKITVISSKGRGSEFSFSLFYKKPTYKD